jgi:hypothetical protein
MGKSHRGESKNFVLMLMLPLPDILTRDERAEGKGSRAEEEEEKRGAKRKGNRALTGKGELGQHQKIKILGVCSLQNLIGQTEIVVHIANLGRKLQTGDAHLWRLLFPASTTSDGGDALLQARSLVPPVAPSLGPTRHGVDGSRSGIRCGSHANASLLQCDGQTVDVGDKGADGLVRQGNCWDWVGTVI